MFISRKRLLVCLLLYCPIRTASAGAASQPVGVFFLKGNVKIGEPVCCIAALPASDHARGTWELYMGETDEKTTSSVLPTSPTMVSTYYRYQSYGKFSPSLVVRNADGEITGFYQSKMEVSMGKTQDEFEKAVAFLIGMVSTFILFVLKEVYQVISDRRARTEQLRAMLGGLTRRMKARLRERPEDPFQPLPNWFIGEGDERYVDLLYSKRFRGILGQIHDTHDAKAIDRDPTNAGQYEQKLTHILSSLGYEETSH